MRWFRRRAASWLIFMYGTGEGVPEDYVEAMRWYRKLRRRFIVLVGRVRAHMWSNLAILRNCCSDTVKGAAIIGGAIIVAMAMWIYFSPYQSCMRAGIAISKETSAERSVVEHLRLANVFCHPNSGQ